MENITDFLFNLSLLFIPGIISSLLIRYLTVHREFTQFYFVIYSLILGIISYSFLEIITQVISVFECRCFDPLCFEVYNKIGENLDFWKLITSEQTNFNLIELIQASGVAVLISIFISWIFNKKYIPKAAAILKITKRSGDDDSWTFFLNLNEVYWIFIRDQDLGITYYGLVKHFSEPGLPKEIVLEDVDVFKTKNSKKLYKLRAVYLDLSKGKFTLEFPDEDGE